MNLYFRIYPSEYGDGSYTGKYIWELWAKEFPQPLATCNGEFLSIEKCEEQIKAILPISENTDIEKEEIPPEVSTVPVRRT